VPVYQKTSLILSDIITDTSPYTVSVDPDITLDSDANGNYEDDYITSGSGIALSATDISFGPYDTLGKRRISMRVVDTYGNETVEPIEIEVYAPIPRIESVSSTGNLSGRIDTEISLEPVHVFRVREGEGISLIDSQPMLTSSIGYFGSGVFAGNGIFLKNLS
jgi:hypothetical protein